MLRIGGIFLLLFILLKLTPAQPTIDSAKTKQQYAFGIIPALSFDADLGLKYGGIINLFDYGEDHSSSRYLQYLYLRITNTTRGTFSLQSVLESETLIPKAKLIAEVSYLADRKMDFFGFNGRRAEFHPELTNAESESYINNFYYAHERRLLRLRMDVQKHLVTNKLRLLAGITYQHFDIDEIDATDARMPGGQGAAPEATLFAQYNEWGIIRDEERNGGIINLLTLGLVYDTRNHLCYCTDGKWIESFLVFSPGFMSDAAFAKWVTTYRQHYSIWNEKITFSGRLSIQNKLWGEIPFYMLPFFFDSRVSQDGVGGAFNLRGALRNRIASDGFLLSNVEVKFKLLEMKLFKQDIYFSASAFWDMAQVTQNYRLDRSAVPDMYYDFYFNNNPQRPHHTFGPGFYIVFNSDNIITVNYGIPVSPQDGPGGLYVGSALLF